MRSFRANGGWFSVARPHNCVVRATVEDLFLHIVKQPNKVALGRGLSQSARKEGVPDEQVGYSIYPSP